MKKVKYLATALAVIITLLLSFDESFALYLNAGIIEIPLQSDCPELSHHHHFSTADYFIHKNTITGLVVSLPAEFQLFVKDQSFTDPYSTFIWQPPEKNY